MERSIAAHVGMVRYPTPFILLSTRSNNRSPTPVPPPQNEFAYPTTSRSLTLITNLHDRFDFASLPQPSAGPLDDDLMPRTVRVGHGGGVSGSFFGKFTTSRRTFSTSDAVETEPRGDGDGKSAPEQSVGDDERDHHGKSNDNDDHGETKGADSSAPVSAHVSSTNTSTNIPSKSLSTTSDHRHTDKDKTPAWKKHVCYWLGEATTSIPSYIERCRSSCRTSLPFLLQVTISSFAYAYTTYSRCLLASDNSQLSLFTHHSSPTFTSSQFFTTRRSLAHHRSGTPYRTCGEKSEQSESLV